MHDEEMKDLEEAVKSQLQIGFNDLSREDRSSLKTSFKTIWSKPVEDIRSWLISLLIARGNLEDALVEGRNPREPVAHKRKNLVDSRHSPRKISRHRK